MAKWTENFVIRDAYSVKEHNVASCGVYGEQSDDAGYFLPVLGSCDRASWT